MTTLCLVCGQPLPPQSRRDQLTCSARCRTRRYRLAQQQATPKGSLPWRRQLRVVRPISFYERTATTHAAILAQEPDPILRPRSVPSPYWDDTLVAMSLLWEADEQLEFVLTWPNNEWGANGDPVTGDTYCDEQNVVFALRSHQDNLYDVLKRLNQLRGPIERWLTPQRLEFGQRLGELRKQIRLFAKEVEWVQTRYKIIYQPELTQTAEAFKEQVEVWWFELCEEVE